MVSLVAEREQQSRRPPELVLSGGPDGRLLAVRHGVARHVSVRLTFPWTEPARFISLRDDEDEEFALVKDAADLDAESRAALEGALLLAGFVFEVTGVVEVEEEVEVRHWRVATLQGERRFQTRLDDWPRVLPAGGLLIRDVGGDLYRIADAEHMDARSRELLWAFVD